MLQLFAMKIIRNVTICSRDYTLAVDLNLNAPYFSFLMAMAMATRSVAFAQDTRKSKQTRPFARTCLII